MSSGTTPVSQSSVPLGCTIRYAATDISVVVTPRSINGAGLPLLRFPQSNTYNFMVGSAEWHPDKASNMTRSSGPADHRFSLVFIRGVNDTPEKGDRIIANFELRIWFRAQSSDFLN